MKKIILILVFVFVAGCSTIPIENSTFEMKNGNSINVKNAHVVYTHESIEVYSDGLQIKFRYGEIKKMTVNRK